MRKRLIEAAILCLQQFGYAATTVQLVMDTASVSRGAMLHHFPTKTDLMVAVAEYAADHQDGHVRARLEQMEPGLEQYLALTRATWEAASLPPSLALLEIMVAARSDAALQDRFAPVARAMEAMQQQSVWELASSLGIRDRDSVQAMVTLHQAAMRGLAIELMSTDDREAVHRSIDLLVRYKTRLTGELLTAGFARG